jgi:hypothetical protein
MKKLVTFLLVVFTFTISSCKLFEEEELINKDYFGKGDSKVWKLKEYNINGLNSLIDCIKDDTFIFNTTTGIYMWKKNIEKCSTTDVDVQFPFTLSDDKKILNIGGNDFEVTQFDHGNLKIQIENNSMKQELWYVPA